MGFSLNMKTMVEKESHKRTNKVKIKKKTNFFYQMEYTGGCRPKVFGT